MPTSAPTTSISPSAATVPASRISAPGPPSRRGGISGTDGRLLPDLRRCPRAGPLPGRPANPALVSCRGRELPLTSRRPSVSGRFLVFQRSKRSGSERVRRVVLYNLVTRRLRCLATCASRRTRGDAADRHRPDQRRPRGLGSPARARSPLPAPPLSHSSVFRHDISQGPCSRSRVRPGSRTAIPRSVPTAPSTSRSTTPRVRTGACRCSAAPRGTPEVVLQPEFSHTRATCSSTTGSVIATTSTTCTPSTSRDTSEYDSTRWSFPPRRSEGAPAPLEAPAG